MKTFFFWRALALVSLVLGLGLEHSCPWPRECLSSERLSLALDFFCVLGLGLEPCVLDSTSGYRLQKVDQRYLGEDYLRSSLRLVQFLAEFPVWTVESTTISGNKDNRVAK